MVSIILFFLPLFSLSVICMHSFCGLENLALAPSGELRCSLWTAGQCMAVQTTFTGVPCVPQIQRSAHHHSDPSRQDHGSCTLSPEAGRWNQLSPHGGYFLQGYLCLQPGVISASPPLALMISRWSHSWWPHSAPGSCPPGGKPQWSVPLPS